MNTIAFAFMCTALAGLSTGIGSTIALFAKRTNTKFLSVSLGFSAGVMIYVSMIEIFVKARELLSALYGAQGGLGITVVGFFGGMLFIGLIDRLIPSEYNPHEPGKNDIAPDCQAKLMRTGVFMALAIALHNFPEGLATFIAALQTPHIALPVVIAIALHNIPEGIAVSVPIYYATGSRRRAFLCSFASGLAEPLGAIVGYLILMPFLNDTIYGILFSGVAGIMVFISFDELLPSAREYGEHHLSIYGLIAGMAIMAISLILFA